MRRQVSHFYDTSMDKNKSEDWLKLLLYSTCQDREILGKILARTRTLHTHTDIIDFVAAEECGKENSERLLSMKEVAARTGLTGGRKGGGRV